MADQLNLLCEEKHKYIEEKLNAHDLQISANTEDITVLKSSAIRTETVVGNLCEQIKELVVEMKEQRKARTDTLLAIAGTALVLAVGFIFWYIQTIPR